MLTRRQFVSILLMVAALFVLFQGPVLVRMQWNDYSHNTSYEETPIPVSYRTSDVSAVFIGDTKSNAYSSCAYWAYLTKHRLLSYDALSGEIVSQMTEDQDETGKVDLVCMDHTVLENSDNYPAIRRILQNGMNVVFVNLPDPLQVMSDKDLQDLLGIYYVQTTGIKADGIHLYQGLFLGGERIYQADTVTEAKKRQDLNLEVPWFVPTAGCRTFMSAIISDSTTYNGLKNQDMPSLIWRAPAERGFVYVINGAYMDDCEIGPGILDGILADVSSCTIYPIVNAQNLVLSGFPVLSDENGRKMQEIYGYSQTSFQKNVIQPAVWSAIRNTGFRPTVMTMASYEGNTSHVADDQMTYYLRELREVRGEAGISYAHASSTDIQQSVNATDQVLYRQAKKYTFGAAYIPAEDLGSSEEILQSREGEGITTALKDYKRGDPLFSVQDNGIVWQSILSETDRHTYTDDLRLLGDESALGYSTTSLNITSALWPKNREQEWENMSADAFGNLETYWKSFSAFDKTTLSESAAKIRSFMNLQMTSKIESGKDGRLLVHISSSGFEGEASYLLRSNDREVQKMSGGSYRKIEDGVYLLKVTKSEATVTLGKAEVE